MIEFMLSQLLVVSLCANAPAGSYNAACSKAVEATSITVGANQFESQISDYAQGRGRYYIGNRLWDTGGFVGGFAYQGIIQKSVSYKIATKKEVFGADFIKPQFTYKDGQRSGSMSVGWSW